MKYITTFAIGVSFLITSLSMNAQASIDPRVQEADAIIKSLYGVISGDKGEARDWDFFKSLFLPDAKLMPIQAHKDGSQKMLYVTPDEYIEMSGKWLVENGFHEVEIARTSDSFGHLMHVFSTYEAYQSEDADSSFMSGINSIQLFNDGTRWWIANIAWQQASENLPIPKTYLPK